MKNIARVILDGNLTHDPEMKRTRTGKAVISLRVAVNHEWGGKDGNKMVSYFQIEAWEKLAEVCGRYLKKGDYVTIDGDMRQDRWEDEKGEKYSRVKVIARDVRFGYPGRKKSEENEEIQEREAA